MKTSHKFRKMATIATMVMVLGLLTTNSVTAAPPPPQPLWIPPQLEVTDYEQNVFSSSNWTASWDVCIYEGAGSYTVYAWFGEGSYYNRVGLSGGGNCVDWAFIYSHVSPGTYYQTWKLTGTGGPDYDYTKVNKIGN